MRVFLVRHGHALHELSDRGKIQIQQSAQKLKDLNLTGVALLSSPVHRAMQSADILRTVLGLDIVREWEYLSDNSDGKTALFGIRKFWIQNPKTECIIGVSHEPVIEGIVGGIVRNASVFEIDLWKERVQCIWDGMEE